MTTATALKHEEFCLPRPGEAEPRVESWRAQKTGPDGVTPAGFVLVVRCTECGSATYDGVKRG